MKESIVASRYAKSLLGLAKEKGLLEEVSKDMLLLTQIAKSDAQFPRILKSPVVSHDKKRAILNALFDGKVGQLTSAFFNLLARKGREGYLPQIALEYDKQYKHLKGIQEAEVVSVASLNNEQKEKIKRMVNKISGKTTIELIEKIDRSLLGGFVLTVDDFQIDQSVKSKINSLKNKFKDNPYIAKY